MQKSRTAASILILLEIGLQSPTLATGSMDWAFMSDFMDRNCDDPGTGKTTRTRVITVTARGDGLDMSKTIRSRAFALFRGNSNSPPDPVVH